MWFYHKHLSVDTNYPVLGELLTKPMEGDDRKNNRMKEDLLRKLINHVVNVMWEVQLVDIGSKSIVTN